MSALPVDAQRAVASLRHKLADAPVQVADGFARVVRNSSSERLEQFMRTPARRVVLDAIFWQMPRHFDAGRAAGVSSTIRWCITGRPDGTADTYELRIAEGRCHVTREPAEPEPRLTITVDGAEFLRLASGNSDPMQAYFRGKLKLAGDIMLAAKLASLFRIPVGRR